MKNGKLTAIITIISVIIVNACGFAFSYGSLSQRVEANSNRLIEQQAYYEKILDKMDAVLEKVAKIEARIDYP